MLIIVIGRSGCGKSTTSAALADTMGVVRLSLDEHFKEKMFDSGMPNEPNLDAGCRGALWATAETLAAAGVSVIVEGPFRPREVLDAVEKTPQSAVVSIVCSRKAACERSNERLRARRRHPGHGSSLRDCTGVPTGVPPELARAPAWIPKTVPSWQVDISDLSHTLVDGKPSGNATTLVRKLKLLLRMKKQ